MSLQSLVRHILGAASFARTQGQDEPAAPEGDNPVQGRPARDSKPDASDPSKTHPNPNKEP